MIDSIGLIIAKILQKIRKTTIMNTTPTIYRPIQKITSVTLAGSTQPTSSVKLPKTISIRSVTEKVYELDTDGIDDIGTFTARVRSLLSIPAEHPVKIKMNGDPVRSLDDISKGIELKGTNYWLIIIKSF